MSVIVPTVEREFPPIRFWSITMAADRFSMTSTLGRPYLGIRLRTNAVYVSLSWRPASAAMVSKTSDDLPEPDTPVKTVIFRLGMRTETFFRLFSRAPAISMTLVSTVAPQLVGRGRAGGPPADDGARPGGGSQRLSRRNLRTDRGKKIAVISAGHRTARSREWCAAQEPPPQPGFPNSSREADTVADSGFHSATVPSQPGMVDGAANTLDRNPTGHTRICTAASSSGFPAIS